MVRRVGVILITALLTFLLLQGRTSAQSAANLQADIFQLRSQVNQLSAQVAQLSRQGASPTRPISGRVPRSPTDPTDAQIVDRLATLAIEAKERLNALEARVTKLEKR